MIRKNIAQLFGSIHVKGNAPLLLQHDLVEDLFALFDDDVALFEICRCAGL